MECLSERMKAILLYLKDKGEISSKELSSQVHVSTRTIKSDMVQIAKIVKNYGAELKAKIVCCCKHSKGLWIFFKNL